MAIDLFTSANQLAADIGVRRVSATETLEAHLAQIERHNPALNAVVILDTEAARARAREADAALARGERWGPLHGVPFTLKDAHAVAGMRSTIGFPPFDHVSDGDGTVATRLKAAGAVLIGKTNAATLLSDYQTTNPIFGRTYNPWNPDRTSGGSSGGGAAAIASGMSPFDVGTDLSGSIRIPAHCCGVAGLKPTERRISLHGVFPLPFPAPRTVRIMSCVSPIARSVEDLALLYHILAGPDGHDTELQPVPIEPVPDLSLKDLRIAVAPTFANLPVAAEIRQAIEDLAQRLGRSGATVATPPLPDLGGDLERTGELIGMITGAADPGDQGPPTTLLQYMTALDHRDRAIVAWEDFLRDWDALLCPPAMIPAFPHVESGTPLRVDGRGESYWTVAAHTAIFNYTGHPAVVIPNGRDRDGLPIGAQLVGRRWSESHLLAVAAAITQVSGGFQRPPGY